MKNPDISKLPQQEMYCLPVFSEEEYRAVQEVLVCSGDGHTQKKDASEDSVGIFFVLYSSFSGGGQKAAESLLPDDRDLFRTMCTYISKNYRENLTLTMIANSAHVSVSKCCRLFRRFSSYSPVSFLNQLRLGQSCVMLLNTELPVARVGAACGFSQPSHFSHAFQKNFGCTPREYRSSKTFPVGRR